MGKQNKSPGRPGTTLKTLLLFVGFVGSFIVVQTWWEIRQDRQLTIDAERASSMAAVRSVQEHAERIFGELDQLLWSGAEHIHGAGPTCSTMTRACTACCRSCSSACPR
jgi:hypothetical protein